MKNRKKLLFILFPLLILLILLGRNYAKELRQAEKTTKNTAATDERKYGVAFPTL